MRTDLLLTSKEEGRRFVVTLIGAVLLLALVYVLAHIPSAMQEEAPRAVADPCAAEAPPATEFQRSLVSVSCQGIVDILDPAGLEWWVGGRATLVVDRMLERNERIYERLALVSELFSALRTQVPSDPGRANPASFPVGTDLRGMHLQGRYLELTAGLRDLIERQVSRGSASAAFQTTHDLLSRTAMELTQLKREQHTDRNQLAPPAVSRLFFWTTPTLSMVEVLFFALFGVLTNLLVNSAEFLRRGDFRPAERWVAYTKLIYGPVLAVILASAIVMGWFDVGNYETRAYTFPVLGFVFGYSSRRVVTLFDKLVERILGSATQSIESGPAEIAERRAALLTAQIQALPVDSLEDLRAKAREVGRAQLKTGAIALEARA